MAGAAFGAYFGSGDCNMNEPHLRSATAAGIVPAVAVDRLKTARREWHVRAYYGQITEGCARWRIFMPSALRTALTTEFPSLHLSFSGSSSVAAARTERVQSRQSAGQLFLPPRSIPAGLSPGSRFRFLATG